MDSQARQSAAEAISNLYDRSKEFASDAADKSREMYSQLSENLPEGSDRILAMAAAGLAIGLVGYQLGKSKARRESVVSQAIEEAPAKVGGFDFSPVYKLAKLWMLYRISV